LPWQSSAITWRVLRSPAVTDGSNPVTRYVIVGPSVIFAGPDLDDTLPLVSVRVTVGPPIIVKRALNVPCPALNVTGFGSKVLPGSSTLEALAGN
jgi:hypothetical protein